MKKRSQRGSGIALRRGFALPIGLIMAVALVGVAGSYLTMTTSLHRDTLRNYSYHALQPVLEQGVDTAMYTLGQYRTGGYSATSWTGWTSNGTGWSKDFGTGFDLGDGGAGAGHRAGLKVTIQNVPTNATGTDSSGKLLYPYIIVEATYEPGAADTFKRQAVVVLKPTTSNSTTGGVGMTVAGSLNFGSNTAKIWFDSYTSEGNAAYGGSNRFAGVTVATAGPAGDVSGSGTIYGYALVGSGNAANAFRKFNVYSSVDPSAAPDATRIASGYSGNFTVPADPSVSKTTTAATISDSDQTLSGSADPALPTYYRTDSFSLSGKSTLTISGNVVLIVPGAISLSGQSNIKLKNGGSLTIYAGGNVSMSGNGVMDGDAAAPDSLMTNKFTLYGINTSREGQSITLSGNAGFSGLIFAPNADVTFNGSGNSGAYYGSLTARSATVNGKINFHYDQSLSSRQTATPSSWASSNWVELRDTWTTDAASSDKMVSMADYGI